MKGLNDQYWENNYRTVAKENDRLADRVEVLEAALHKIDDTSIDHVAVKIARAALAGRTEP